MSIWQKKFFIKLADFRENMGNKFALREKLEVVTTVIRKK